MALDVPSFMQDTPLYNGFFTEDLGHAGRQGFGAVDDDEHPGLRRQAAGHQVGQQGGDHGLVLGVAQPQPDGDLGAVGGDSESGHASCRWVKSSLRTLF